MDLGASGVMVAPPSTVRTDDQIIAYFDMVNETLGPSALGAAGPSGLHRRADVDRR